MDLHFLLTALVEQTLKLVRYWQADGLARAIRKNFEKRLSQRPFGFRRFWPNLEIPGPN